MRRLAIATLVAVVLVPASRALAFGSYADALPNGRALFDALGDQSVTTCGGKVDGGPRCLLCHETATGGQNAAYHCGNCSDMTRRTSNPSCNNAFGLAFRANGGVWNAALASLDSDGDGWTNGQELGDPFGAWRKVSGGSLSFGAGYRSNPALRTNVTPAGGGNPIPGEPADMNLCSMSGYSDCATHASCADTYSGTGQWTCTCATGYDGNGHRTVGPWSTGTQSYVPGGGTACTLHDCGAIPTVANGTHDAVATTYGSVATYHCSSGYQRIDGSTSTCTGAGWSAPPTCVRVDCGAPPTIANGTRTYSATTSGSRATYACGKGYRLSGASALTCTQTAADAGGSWGTAPTCVNIVECAAATNPCLQGGAPSGVCTDTIGSYTCACPTGWAFDRTTCVVTNACLSGQDDCSPNAGCTPLQGSAFTCACQAGWTGTGHGTNGCADVDECASSTANGCTSPHAICVNTLGSYACTCAQGFLWDAATRSCPNENECLRSTRPCATKEACVDTVGSFRCVACGANAHRTGGAGAETCSCDTGFQGDPYAGCGDVDECAPSVRTCPTTSACVNASGRHTCTACGEHASPTGPEGAQVCRCDAGFVGDPMTVCSDVDECATSPGPCSTNATCENTSGSYVCTCHAGYQGTGRVCLDVDECASNGGGCAANEVCVNQVGAPRLCVCAPGTTRPTGDPSGACASTCGNGLRVSRESCDDGNTVGGDGCSATCTVEPGWACHETTQGGTSDCRKTCGDGTIDVPFEECDDGAQANSDVAPDACRSSCKHPYCGDGIVDPARGERCDHGDGRPLPDDSCATREGCRRSGMPTLDDGGLAADGGPPRSSGSGCHLGVPLGSSDASIAGSLVMAALGLLRRLRARAKREES